MMIWMTEGGCAPDRKFAQKKPRGAKANRGFQSLASDICSEYDHALRGADICQLLASTSHESSLCRFNSG